MDEASFTIIVQRPWMDRYDSLAGHHVLDVQGRQRGVQAPEVGEILEHRLDDGISQLIWLIARCDEHGLRADCRDIVGVAGVHAAGDDIGDVIGMRRKEPIDRRASDAHQPRLAARRRLLGQSIGMPRFKNDRVDFVATKRLVLFGGLELQPMLKIRYRPAIQSEDDIAGEGISGTALPDADALATQKEQLNDFLGRDIRTEFRVSPVSAATDLETDLKAAQLQALTARPELRQSRLQVQQAEMNRRITKSGYLPDVSLSFHNLTLSNIQLLPSNVASVGVLVTWTPFDWGRRSHELAENTRQIEQARNGLTEAQSQVLVDVNSKFRKLQESRLLLEAAGLTREAQKENLRVVMNQFEQKTALMKDVLQARASLANADKQYQQALLSVWTAKADFEKALGED